MRNLILLTIFILVDIAIAVVWGVPYFTTERVRDLLETRPVRSVLLGETKSNVWAGKLQADEATLHVHDTTPLGEITLNLTNCTVSFPPDGPGQNQFQKNLALIMGRSTELEFEADFSPGDLPSVAGLLFKAKQDLFGDENGKAHLKARLSKESWTMLWITFPETPFGDITIEIQPPWDKPDVNVGGLGARRFTQWNFLKNSPMFQEPPTRPTP